MKFVLKNIDFSRINLFFVLSLFFLSLSYFILKSFIGNNEFSDNLFTISCIVIFEIIFLSIINNFNQIKIKKRSDLILLFLFFFLIYFLWNDQIITNFLYFVYFVFFQILTAILFLLNEYNFKYLKSISLINILSIFILSCLCTGLFHQIEGNNLKEINILVGYFILYTFFFKLIKNLDNKKFFIFDILFSALFFLLFFKVFLLSSVKDSFHYSWYLGPTFSSIVGGNLLVDTVSQYGYLSILFIKYFSLFTQINIENSFIFLIIIFFLIFYAIFLNVISKVIKYPYFILTLFLCLLIFGVVGISNLSGGMFIPSSSVYRFLPSIVTIFFLTKIINSNNKNFFLNSLLFFLFFSISFLWSFESLFFVSFTLVSFIFFLILDFCLEKKLYLKKNNIPLIDNKKKPFLISIFIFTFLFIYFLLIGKDFSLFYEYIFGFEGLKTLGILNSRVSILFVTFLLLNYLIVRSSFSLNDKKIFSFNLLWFALFISFSSYFIARSHPNNAFSLFPFFIFFTSIYKISNTNLISFREIFLKIIIIFTIVSSLSSIHNDKKKFFNSLYSNNFFQSPTFKFDNYEPSERIKKILQENKNLPVTLITGSTIHKLNSKLNLGGYGLPILPLEQFNILSSQRKNLIMQKLFKKNDTHLILCLIDCSFYIKSDQRKTWESIYYPENIKLKKIIENKTENKKEIIYILKLKS